MRDRFLTWFGDPRTGMFLALLSIAFSLGALFKDHVTTLHPKPVPTSAEVQREVQPPRRHGQALPAEAGVLAPVAGNAVSANPVLTHESSKSSRASDGHLGALSNDVSASSSSLNMRPIEARREFR